MRDLIDLLYGEHIDPLEAAPLDPIFPEIEWIGVGDVVVVHGKQEDMLGVVKDTDPAEDKALVRSWSREVGVWYTYWWDLEVIELAATAGTTAA